MKKLNLTLKIIYLILISFGLQFNSYSQEWFIQNTSVNSSDLYSVNFIDESIGWIVGDNNTILKTIAKNTFQHKPDFSIVINEI